MPAFPILGHEYPLILVGAAYGLGPVLTGFMGVAAEQFLGTASRAGIQGRYATPLGLLCAWLYLWFWIFGALGVR